MNDIRNHGMTTISYLIDDWVLPVAAYVMYVRVQRMYQEDGQPCPASYYMIGLFDSSPEEIRAAEQTLLDAGLVARTMLQGGERGLIPVDLTIETRFVYDGDPPIEERERRIAVVKEQLKAARQTSEQAPFWPE